jgi:hypothetical protein
MLIVDGVEYGTKEEAAGECRQFVLRNPGTKFMNFAHYKEVRRDTTQEERDAELAFSGWMHLTVTLYAWDKVYTDSPVLVAHPELRGMWRRTK